MSAVLVQQGGSSPAASSEFLFGDQVMHARFFTAIEILAQMVVATPRPVSGTSLSGALGQPVRTVRVLLNSLCAGGLIGQDPKIKDMWFCSAPLQTITLADVFRCISSANIESSSSLISKTDPGAQISTRNATQLSVDLLLMQATMAVNQVVLQHLQQFDLGRLRAVTSSSALHVFKPVIRSYGAEPC